MTIFRRSILTLSLAALGLSAALLILALVFMNSLYYEINAGRLNDTAKTILSIFGQDHVAAYITENSGTGGDNTIDNSVNNTVNESIANKLLVFRDENAVCRLTLIAPSGDVVWDSAVESGLVNHIDREEVQAALGGREGSARRKSLSTGMRRMYHALPVYDLAGNVAGVFRVSFTVPAFWRRVAPAALPFFAFAALLAVIALAVVAAFSRSLSSSLNRLVGIAGTWAGGPPYGEHPLVSISGEASEIATLETALRSMAAELNRRIEHAEAEGRQLKAILNGMSEAVIGLDEKLMVRQINPRARSLFNLTERDTNRLSLLEATHSTELESAARKVLSKGRSLDMELKFRSSGPEQIFQVFAAPLSPPSAGNGAGAEGIVMVMEDITRLVRLEQVRKDFVANVSHELRTPIQLIKGFSETLLDSPINDSEQLRHYIEIIRKNAGTMENLTNDLLILASLENGDNSRSDFEEQRIASLLAESVSPVELQAKRKNISIIRDCSDGLTAKVHGSFIIQAVINLLDNAIKYSPDNSVIRASAYLEKDEMVLEVTDQGIGIPAEHLERIFERFYRVDRSRSREAGGTGLGLSIVRHIALLHAGRAEVESHAGEGSVFRIRIPRTQA